MQPTTLQQLMMCLDPQGIKRLVKVATIRGCHKNGVTTIYANVVPLGGNNAPFRVKVEELEAVKND